MSENIAVARPAFKDQSKPGKVRIKNIALPVEHGGWGLSLEPIVMGLSVAPSIAGLCLAVATMGAFLARHPLKIVLADRARGRRFPRTPVAERFFAFYGAVAALGVVAACVTSTDLRFVWPLVLATPLAAVQLIYDVKGRTRALLPELSGATAMAAVAAAIALTAGWVPSQAFGLWAILAARIVPTIFYVRACIKRLHGKKASSMPPLVAHMAAAAAVLSLTLVGLTPILPVCVLLLLLARAVAGLYGNQQGITAKRIGFAELGYGALLVISLAAGHYLGW
jgi:YwiC-like protein